MITMTVDKEEVEKYIDTYNFIDGVKFKEQMEQFRGFDFNLIFLPRWWKLWFAQILVDKEQEKIEEWNGVKHIKSVSQGECPPVSEDGSWMNSLRFDKSEFEGPRYVKMPTMPLYRSLGGEEEVPADAAGSGAAV